MSRITRCDRCHKEFNHREKAKSLKIEIGKHHKREYTPFIDIDLCPNCTAQFQRFLNKNI